MKNHGEKWIFFFHIDNGGEFINKNILKNCEINGIIKYSTMSYTLEQNGIAKWKKIKNKKLVKSVQFIWNHVKLSNGF